MHPSVSNGQVCSVAGVGVMWREGIACDSNHLFPSCNDVSVLRLPSKMFAIGNCIEFWKFEDYFLLINVLKFLLEYIKTITIIQGNRTM